MATMALWIWTWGVASIQIQDSCKYLLCFKKHLIPNDYLVQTCNCFLLGKAITIELVRPCAKFSSLNHCPNSCWYPMACGLAMCVEPTSRILVAFKCPYYQYITYILVMGRLFSIWF